MEMMEKQLEIRLCIWPSTPLGAGPEPYTCLQQGIIGCVYERSFKKRLVGGL